MAFPEGSIEEKEGNHADKDLLVLVEAFAASSFYAAFFLTSSPERQGKVFVTQASSLCPGEDRDQALCSTARWKDKQQETKIEMRGSDSPEKLHGPHL